MSSALPYLNRQLKSHLQGMADECNLQGHKNSNKTELAAALDDHLRANQSRYSGNATFEEYYSRLSQSTRSSPEEGTPSTTKKSPRGRGRSRKAEEIESSPDESPAPTTPARRGLRSQIDASPMSPQVLTNAIDNQTERMRQKVSDAWTASGMTERSDSLRAMLSSMKAVEALFFALEGACILHELVPMRYLTTVPAADALRLPEFAIKVPDLFILVDSSFWAPYSLWLLTNLLLPLGVAYFFNLSLNAARGRGSARKSTFDPLSFNIAKALIAYRVYATQYTFCGFWSVFSVERVNDALPGQWAGVLTGTAIGAVGTLYEAILRK